MVAYKVCAIEEDGTWGSALTRANTYRLAYGLGFKTVPRLGTAGIHAFSNIGYAKRFADLCTSSYHIILRGHGRKKRDACRIRTIPLGVVVGVYRLYEYRRSCPTGTVLLESFTAEEIIDETRIPGKWDIP